ncbi:uncharacterized protein FIBRA_03856 [Fibroporia radiculosa]|uniref:DUF6533 domain-containing protein n=1 Tax=Fibroporia radiculosa TaxID=599839 RepID=J4H2M6_9APHY|nr:uncharacterized protein FIBRA_03856 [Fibroporia radiculosa]CCM01789.1 predicted protein [Fibroporia radiculosa]
MAMKSTADILSVFLKDVQTIRYSELASSIIIVYDQLLTLDQEYELIWHVTRRFFIFDQPLSVTVLYLSCLQSLVSLTTEIHTVGLTWYRWQGWTGVITFVIAELILQLRLYALYLLDKRILIFMVTCSLAAAASSAAIMGSVLANITATAHPFPGYSFCYASGISAHFYAFWIPMLVSESVLCGLALVRFMQSHRARSTLFMSGMRLVERLIRDSVFYFIVSEMWRRRRMFATYLVNAIVFVVGTTAEVEIPVGFAVALSCILGNRLCLNVRGMIRAEQELSCTSFSVTVEDSRLPTTNEMPVFTVESGSQLPAIQLSELRTMKSTRSW